MIDDDAFTQRAVFSGICYYTRFTGQYIGSQRKGYINSLMIS